MKELKKLGSLLLITVMLSGGTTTASPTPPETSPAPTCDQVLEKCDLAVTELEEVVADQHRLVLHLKADVYSLEQEASRWYKNKWLWMGAGLLVGVAGAAAAGHALR